MATCGIATGVENGLDVLAEGDEVGQLGIGGGVGANLFGAGGNNNRHCTDN